MKENEIREDIESVETEVSEETLYTYTHKFKKTFTYNGKDYDVLHFDWDSLTGEDSLNIEAELQALGKSFVAEEFSGEYLIRFAAKCCTETIGSDALRLMPLKDYKRIKARARSFLLTSE